jgi:hypothetical protein
MEYCLDTGMLCFSIIFDSAGFFFCFVFFFLKKVLFRETDVFLLILCLMEYLLEIGIWLDLFDLLVFI